MAISPSLKRRNDGLRPLCEVMADIHCIVNPASRDHTCGKRWPGIEKKIQDKGFTVITHMTKEVGHASQIAWDLRQQLSLIHI